MCGAGGADRGYTNCPTHKHNTCCLNYVRPQPGANPINTRRDLKRAQGEVTVLEKHLHGLKRSVTSCVHEVVDAQKTNRNLRSELTNLKAALKAPRHPRFGW